MLIVDMVHNALLDQDLTRCRRRSVVNVAALLTHSTVNATFGPSPVLSNLCAT